MTKAEVIYEHALRQIALKTLRRKLLKNPPSAADYWTEFFCTPKEWSTWVEDLGELAKDALEAGEKKDD
jgi:hypothetical protein